MMVNEGYVPNGLFAPGARALPSAGGRRCRAFSFAASMITEKIS